MKYLIIGAGGTGGCLGGYLLKAGNEVCFIARGEHLKAMKQQGLTLLTEHMGAVCLNPVHACTMEEYTETPDVVFVCVKYYALEETIAFLNRVADKHTLVIPILNVFGTGAVLAQHCPNCTVLDGCIYIYSMIQKPGVIRQPSGIFRVFFGYRPDQPHLLCEQAKQVEADLNQANIDAHFTQYIGREALQKFSFVSPMGAAQLYCAKRGGAFKNPGPDQDILLSLIREVEKLGHAMGIEFTEDLVSVNIDILKRLDDDSTTSMVRDVERGGQSEIDGLVHRVVRLGKEYHISLPTYEKISRWAKEKNIL